MIVELQNISKVIMGQSPKGDSYNENLIGLPLLNGAADYKGNKFKPKKYTSEPTRIAEKGDILLGIRATIGNFTFADKKYCIGRGVAAIRVDETKADRRYILKCVENELGKIIHKAAGSTIKGIKKEDLTEMKLNLPPLPQQQKIAAILDEADRIRQLNKQIISKYNQLTQSLFLDMFGDPVTNSKGWEKKRLKDVCIKVTDGTHHSPIPQTSGYPYVTAKHVKYHGLDFNHKPTYITKEAHNEIYKRCSPEFGDVLYIKDGATTGIACINTFHEPISLLSSLALLKLNNKELSNYYLCNWLNHNGVKRKLIMEYMSGAAIQRYTLTKINTFSLPIPPLLLQNQFADRVQAIETQKAKAQASLQKSDDLFNSLLQRAFKGELV